MVVCLVRPIVPCKYSLSSYNHLLFGIFFKVEAEYEAKESQEGTAKMKWDSKLRLRQSKLATAGKSMDRAAVLALFLDEAIVAAEDKVLICKSIHSAE